MKNYMEEKRFADIAEMKKNDIKTLLGITKDEFKKCFEQIRQVYYYQWRVLWRGLKVFFLKN